MRIASYYPDIGSVGRNDGGPLYHTQKLRDIFGADNVMHLLPIGDLSKYGSFDLHYWVDFGDDALGMTDFVCPKPNVYIASDTHLGFEYRLKKAREFDWVFCNQRKAVEDFVKAGIPEDRCFWLPHAFDPQAFSPGVWNDTKNDFDRDAVPVKRYDVCFIGNLNDENRVLYLDRLFKELPKFYFGNQRFHLCSQKFNESKIVFNVSAKSELNMRQFEALGSGAFLLTDLIPDSEAVFRSGAHLMSYSGIDDMIDKARYYLSHDEEREAIAYQGHKEALENHTYLHRVIKVLDTIGIQYDREAALKMLPRFEIKKEVLA